MSRASLLAMIATSVAALLAVTSASPREQAPDAAQGRRIPGINAPDNYPRGCVDCHVKKGEEDSRISTLMKQWVMKVNQKLLAASQAAAPPGMKLVGKHPQVNFSLANIPGGCTPCHGRASESAPPFSRLMHSIHLPAGANNKFVSEHKGECTHCHKLNTTRGQWTTPSAPEKV